MKQVSGVRFQVSARLALLAWACLLSCNLDLRAAARPRYGGTLRLSFSQSAETYDPALAATLPERLVSRAVYETLTTLDEQGAAAQGLAVGWQSELGGKRWVFQLPAGVRFHNGTPLTAAAVRASLERSVARASGPTAAHLRRLQLLCASPAPNRVACDMAEPVLALPEMLADLTLAIADADGSGTGPWKLAAWVKGTSARLEAFDAYWQGRPFLDAVEAEFGSDARRQRVDFELKRADVLAIAPTEARAPGVSRGTQPTNLLLLAFHPNGAFARGAAGTAARRALAAALDREALARLLPPGRADAAEAFLPGWLSGYEFLFARGSGTATRPASSGALPRSPLRLIYDESDPVARLIALRLVLDLRTAGMELRPEGLPHAGFTQAREAGHYDLFLESLSLRVESPAAALAELFFRYNSDKLPEELLQAWHGPTPAEIHYRLELVALDSLRALPLVHFREQYSFQPGLEQVRPDENGMLDLANAWKQR